MEKYHDQLAAVGIPFHVEHVNMGSPSDGTMSLILRNIRKFATLFSSYEKIVITDAWDILCYGSREDIMKAIPDDRVLWAAERNCYPEPYLAESIPGETPWRFVNGGGVAGTPSALLSFADKCENHPSYDPSMIGQQWKNRRLAEKWDQLSVDQETRLMYCMYLEHIAPALGRVDDRPYNYATGQYPCFVHFNGSYSPKDFLEMMK
jgi:hypothetical protein